MMSRVRLAILALLRIACSTRALPSSDGSPGAGTCPTGTVTVDLALPGRDHSLNVTVEDTALPFSQLAKVTIPYPSGQSRFTVDVPNHPDRVKITITYGDVNT